MFEIGVMFGCLVGLFVIVFVFSILVLRFCIFSMRVVVFLLSLNLFLVLEIILFGIGGNGFG